MKNFLSKNTTFICIVFIVIIVFCVLYMFSMNNNQSIDEIEFSTYEWNLYPSKRIYMIQSLIQKYDLTKMDKDEAIGLLGEDFIVQGSTIIYYLGEKESWFSYNLYLNIDEYGKVKSFSVYKD